MTDASFILILLLLGTTVTVVVIFHWLRIPSSLGYLLVGVLLGPHTAGPVIEEHQIRGAAELGIVFLLFTIGLNFSLPQIYALRHQVLGLGTGQVVLTTACIGVLAWWIGLPPEAAFVVGAVFAQSSTTIISKQLAEQGEERSRHGLLGTALSVFQDVTAVPFVVVIPVLGFATAEGLVRALGWVLAKAILAFFLVFLAGHWLLRPLFHAVASRRSTELFTLTVLFVSLGAAWITHSLGLSMAFGAFLIGMMLGNTEFRHQVESTIRPFRDVLLGLFFISIGMLFDPSEISVIWRWVLGGATILLGVKTLLVAFLMRFTAIDALTTWRVAFLVAVGGEFGFALLAIALGSGVIEKQHAQTALMAVLFSMMLAPLLIRYNHGLAALIAGRGGARDAEVILTAATMAVEHPKDHVILCGYGRIGQSVGHVLEGEKIPYVALDLDPSRVKEARMAGEPVYYGDSSERDILEAVGIGTARLVVISHEDLAAALKVLHHVQSLRADLPVMVRTRDESHIEELKRAGAAEVVPETLEAGLMIASYALLLLKVPLSRVVRVIRDQRARRYLLLREIFPSAMSDDPETQNVDRLRPVLLAPGSRAIGNTLRDLALDGVVVTALVRYGQRVLAPPEDTLLELGDVVVLFGALEDLQNAENGLLG